MPYATTDDRVKLWYEETGAGQPIVFVHEFAADHRSWEPQMRHFGQRYRCITFSARGYPPSDVPEKAESYSQNRATDDIASVMDHLKIDKAHVVGLSMGAFATLHFGIRYPERALSLTVAGGGYGAHPAQYEKFQTDAKANAQLIRDKGMAYFAANYGHPTRIQLKNKDPRGYAHYVRLLGEHSVDGSANTMLGYQARRPSLYGLTEEMKKIPVPTLILAGDEEEPCLEACLLMKRCIPKAGLALLPKSGHTINLEEPSLFNRLLEDFLHRVQAGRWTERDPHAAPASIWGPSGKP